MSVLKVLEATALVGVGALALSGFGAEKVEVPFDAIRDIPRLKAFEGRDCDFCNVGSNSGLFGFDWESAGVNGANFATGPQSLAQGFALLEHFADRLAKDCTVFIPICPFSSISVPDRYGPERQYKIYPFMSGKDIYLWTPERAAAVDKAVAAATAKWTGADPRLLEADKPVAPEAFRASVDSLLKCWRKDFEIADFTAPLSARNRRAFQANAKIMRKGLEMCRAKGWRTIVVLPPVTRYYDAVFPDKVWRQYVDDFVAATRVEGVPYWDYSRDERFRDDANFFNSLMMNRRGRALFTAELVRRAKEKPNLRFGVLSDVHIGGRKAAPERLKFALDYLAAQNVDAVLVAGDLAHSGLISQVEQFASIWYGAFPGGRAADGHEVKLLLVSGNHDAAAGWVKGDDAWRTANVLSHKDNFTRVWERLFHEKWELVWKREVKGYTFVGAQWSSLKPPIEAFMAEHRRELEGTKPFFFCQHAHPKGTCHGPFASDGDQGEAGRALKDFPNAVAFSGHSHSSIADERTVWQGAYTSIGAGCLHEGGAPFWYDNVMAFWYDRSKAHLMGPLGDDPEGWGGDPEGGCFELVDVFPGHLRIRRRSSVWNLPIGEDWIVPLPAKADGSPAFAARAAKRTAPEFAAGAVLKAEVCPKGHRLEGKTHRGEPCVYVAFPAAKAVNGCRVFDYVVTARVDGQVVKTLTIFAPGAALPAEKSDRPGECLFALKDFPAGKRVTFAAVPRESFGKAGKSLEGSCQL